MTDPMDLLDRVEVVDASTTPLATEGVLVRPIWKGVDRPDVGGWCFPVHQRELAERLKRAIEDGLIILAAEIRVDCDGDTYVAATYPPLGRHTEATLTRLGRGRS